MHRLKYTLVYILPVTVWVSFTQSGYWVLLPPLVFFGLVPLLELFLKPDHSNFEKRIADDEKNKPLYDLILYCVLPIQIGLLIFFFYVIGNTEFWSMEFYGRIFAMGMLCGVMGINVGHELGHRHARWEQFLGEILLLTSLNTHFLPYHNAGHHRNVATLEDSATARKNEVLFFYWFRSHFGSYIEAWKLENKRMQLEGKPLFSLQNRMVVYSIANIVLISTIYFVCGMTVLWAFIGASVIGILLLETINYIEHYGLMRKKRENGRYEAVKHIHSWNSDHPLGRMILFNLSRHSDHHYNGSKKYQILKSHESSPQMPTGYPGMIILAILQPLWFMVMNKKLKVLE